MVSGPTPRRGRAAPALLAGAALALALAAAGAGCHDPQPTAPPSQPQAQQVPQNLKAPALKGNRRTPP